MLSELLLRKVNSIDVTPKSEKEKRKDDNDNTISHLRTEERQVLISSFRNRRHN